MKENMRNGILQLEESRETLVSLEFKMGEFSAWIEETSEKLDDCGMKIEILKNGKNNSTDVIQNLTELRKNCEDKKSDREFLSSQGSKLVEKCRLELAATIKIAELAAKYQNLVGKVQFRVKSAKTCAGILEELGQKIESFDLWMEEITERYQKLTETDKKTPPSDHFQNALKEVTGRSRKILFGLF